MADLDLSAIHSFAAQLALDAGAYLRDQALARTARARGGTAYDLELTIKENSAVRLFSQLDLAQWELGGEAESVSETGVDRIWSRRRTCTRRR